MPLCVVKIREPHTIIRRDNSFSRLIYLGFQTIKFVMLGYYKSRNASSHIYAHPNFIFLDEGENFFVCNGVNVAYYQKFLFVFIQL